MNRAAFEKIYVNGRLMAVQAHHDYAFGKLPKRLRVEAIEVQYGIMGRTWAFPVFIPGRFGDDLKAREGDVLVVRWVWADAPHYVKRDGRWWQFESRKAYQDWWFAMSKGWAPAEVPREVSL